MNDLLDQDYSLKLAKKHVEEYSKQDSIKALHNEAMECRDCEDWLEIGLEAFRWLKQADQTIRQAAVEGFAVSSSAPNSIATLYRAWLRPCDRAEGLAKEQIGRGFRLKNLTEFREACEFVRQQVRIIDLEDALDEAQQGEVFDEVFWQRAALKRSDQSDSSR